MRRLIFARIILRGFCGVFHLSAKICLCKIFKILLSAKINARKTFAKIIQIRLNFTFGLKSQIIYLFYFVLLFFFFFKYRNEQKVNMAVLMLNQLKNWNRCISFKSTYISLKLFQYRHEPLGNLKSLRTLFLRSYFSVVVFSILWLSCFWITGLHYFLAQ